MQKLRENFLEIAKKQRGLLLLMILLFLVSLGLLIFALVVMGSGQPTVIAGYGDLESYGYRFGTWADMLALPTLAVLFGVVHNFLAVRMFEKRGSGWAKVVVTVSIVLVIATVIVLGKLLGEG